VHQYPGSETTSQRRPLLPTRKFPTMLVTTYRRLPANAIRTDPTALGETCPARLPARSSSPVTLAAASPLGISDSRPALHAW
jgi:hypothetical protein